MASTTCSMVRWVSLLAAILVSGSMPSRENEMLCLPTLRAGRCGDNRRSEIYPQARWQQQRVLQKADADFEFPQTRKSFTESIGVEAFRSLPKPSEAFRSLPKP